MSENEYQITRTMLEVTSLREPWLTASFITDVTIAVKVFDFDADDDDDFQYSMTMWVPDDTPFQFSSPVYQSLPTPSLAVKIRGETEHAVFGIAHAEYLRLERVDDATQSETLLKTKWVLHPDSNGDAFALRKKAGV